MSTPEHIKFYGILFLSHQLAHFALYQLPLLHAEFGEHQKQPPLEVGFFALHGVADEAHDLGVAVPDDEHITLAGAEPLLAYIELAADGIDYSF